MPAEKRHKLIITGTGRAGTTFLVQLLTELGLDTGYTPATWRRDYEAHCAAGLEHDLEDPTSPYIVKNPALSSTLGPILARGGIEIDFAIVPIRRLSEAALSRVRVGGAGKTPGGLTGTDDPARQAEVLARQFHELVETLVHHDIPHRFLHFPRFARQPDYAYAQLQPALGAISREEFRAAFARVVRPELIHAFDGALPTDAGQPARHYHTRKRHRRLWRTAGRCAAGALLFGLGWVASNLADDDPDDSVPSARSVARP